MIDIGGATAGKRLRFFVEELDWSVGRDDACSQFGTTKSNSGTINDLIPSKYI